MRFDLAIFDFGGLAGPEFAGFGRDVAANNRRGSAPAVIFTPTGLSAPGVEEGPSVQALSSRLDALPC